MCMIKRPENTKEKGTIEFLLYGEKDKFVGVCLTFDIIEVSDDAFSLRKSLESAAFLQLKTVQEKNLPDELLNRYAPKKYWDKYFEGLQKTIQKPIPNLSFFASPYFQSSTIESA